MRWQAHAARGRQWSRGGLPAQSGGAGAGREAGPAAKRVQRRAGRSGVGGASGTGGAAARGRLTGRRRRSAGGAAGDAGRVDAGRATPAGTTIVQRQHTGYEAVVTNSGNVTAVGHEHGIHGPTWPAMQAGSSLTSGRH